MPRSLNAHRLWITVFVICTLIAAVQLAGVRSMAAVPGETVPRHGATLVL